MTSGPWNRGRTVGQRTAFTPAECRLIVETLSVRRLWRDLCLFRLGVDSMLRVGDLARLRVEDVLDANGIVETIRWRQQKSDRGVFPALTVGTREACARWLHLYGRSGASPLFSAEGRNTPLHTSSLRRLVKRWASWIGKDPRHYSGHSLRRTKPLYLYDQGVPIERISKLLGHSSLETTLIYLDIRLSEAQADTLRHDIFAARQRRAKLPSPWSDADIDRLATAVARKMKK